MAAALGGHKSVGTTFASGAASATTAAFATTGGANTVVDVQVSWYNNGGQTAPTGVTLNGNACTLVGSIQSYSGDTKFRTALYRIIGAAGSGSSTATATFAAGQAAISVWAVEAVNCDTAAITTAYVEDDVSPYASSSVSPSTGALLVAYLLSGGVSGTETIVWGNSFTAISGDTITDLDNNLTGGPASRTVSAGTYNSSHTSSAGGTNLALLFLVAYPDAGGASASDPVESAARRQLRQNSGYRMSPRTEHEAQQFLRARKR